MRKAALVGEPLAIPLREATAPLVIAVDIGTSGLRSFLFDSRGRPIARAIAHRDRPLRVSNDGEATVDPDERVRATADAIDETVAAAGKRAADIAVVAVCAFWHSVMGVDTRGRPTTPVLTWADTRARDAAAALRRELDPVATHARTGCTIHASYLPAKLRYLRDAAPDAFGRTAKWLSLGEYLYFRLFGGTRAAHGMASATGTYDQRKRTWDEPLLDRLRVPARSLATISDDPQSGLRAEFARRWPALAKIPWTPAIGDGVCSNVGVGAVGRKTAALSLGTSGAIRVVYAALPGIDRIIATGGTLLRLSWLAQLFADALGRPLVMSAVGEGSARGAAIVALERVGLVGDLGAVRSPVGRTWRPRPDAHKRLVEGLARQRRFEEALQKAR